MERNLTTGSVWRTVVSFSLPYLLSYFLQTLYGMADLFIIGRFNGVESTTAVSIGSQVMHMLTVIIVGLAMGSTVLIGQAVGREDRRETAQVTGNTVTLFMVVSLAMTAGLLWSVDGIVAVMSTPAAAVPGTRAYLMVCFAGIPFITAYNIISSVLRGMGDSKSPMYFVAAACVVNIGLDCLFIGKMSLGPMGAALGTTLSQTASVLLALGTMARRRSGPALALRDLRPQKRTMARLLKIGLPVAAQDGFIQVAFIVITVIANRRGLDDAAAVGIVEKVIGILFLVPSSMLSAVSALSAQNIGAGRPDRARLTLRYAACIAVGWGIFASLVMTAAAEPFVGLFADSSTASNVIRLGGQYMRGYVWDCIFAGVHFCFSGYFCACGLSGISFVHNSLSILCVRIPVAYFASARFAETLFPMGLASPAGSMLSVLICAGAYLWLLRREEKI